MKLKTGYKVGLLIIGACLIYNGLWYFNQISYKSYSEGYELYFNAYGKTTDAAQYTVSYPSYPGLSGNFAIGNLEDTLSIIMWPGLFTNGIKEYGVIIVDENMSYQIYVDENLNYLETSKNNFIYEEKEYVQTLLEQHKGELSRLLDLAHNEFGI